jgi:urease accessory protein
MKGAGPKVEGKKGAAPKIGFEERTAPQSETRTRILPRQVAAWATYRGACTFAAITMLTFAPPVIAHDGHTAHGFVAGLLHPLTGIDHLLPMIAVGWWSANTRAKHWAAIPAVFAAAMLLGALLALGGTTFAATEIIIALSLPVFATLMLMRRRIDTGLAMLLAAAFALAHGLAHGNELAPASASSWLAGMLGATLALHGVGAIAGGLTRERARWATPVAGAGGVGIGLVLVLGLALG